MYRFVVAAVVVAACSGEKPQKVSKLGESCLRTSDCEGDARCVTQVCTDSTRPSRAAATPPEEPPKPPRECAIFQTLCAEARFNFATHTGKDPHALAKALACLQVQEALAEGYDVSCAEVISQAPFKGEKPTGIDTYLGGMRERSFDQYLRATRANLVHQQSQGVEIDIDGTQRFMDRMSWSGIE